MPDRIEALFEDSPQFYPGSRHQIPVEPVPVEEDFDQPGWDAKPLKLKVRGVEIEFFTVGQVAAALGRHPKTLREWEAHGIIPKARYRTANVDPKKAKRLYSRAQAEGMIRIAWSEGLMRGDRCKIPATFTERVVALFKRLEA